MREITHSEFSAALEWAAKAPELIIDIETNGRDIRCPDLNPVVQGIAVAFNTPAGLFSEYYSFGHIIAGANLPAEWLPRLGRVISEHPRVVGHNILKFDEYGLGLLGIKLQGRVYDTMLMAHLINENIWDFSLDALGTYFKCGNKVDSETMKQAKKSGLWAYIPINELRKYAAQDAVLTYKIYKVIEPVFRGDGFDGEYWDNVCDFARMMLEIECNGVLIDPLFCEQQLDIGEERMEEIVEYLGLNPGSPNQLRKLLLDELGLPVVKKTKASARFPEGQPSMDKEAMEIYDEMLERSDDKRAKLIKEYRGWSKAVSACYKAYLTRVHPDGRLRTNFKLHGTVTGRMSSSGPNLQQIPRKSKYEWNRLLKANSFQPAPGYKLYEFDYGQLEFRLGAAYAREAELIELFGDPDADVFQAMADTLEMERHDCKTLNYTLQYGGGAKRISHVFGKTQAQAQEIIDNYFSNYPRLKYWSTKAERVARERGYVQYWSGRRRHFGRDNREFRKAGNSIIQGGAFEIVKYSMLRTKRSGILDIPEECRGVLQVHDSAVYEIREDLVDKYVPEIHRIMEDVQPKFPVTFKVDAHEWGH
jgi:DNA polymerase-1